MLEETSGEAGIYNGDGPRYRTGNLSRVLLKSSEEEEKNGISFKKKCNICRHVIAISG